ncbi:MAG: AraC family transcriptional regulator [Pseudomonadota bacterium]
MTAKTLGRPQTLSSSILRSLVERVSDHPEVVQRGLRKFNLSRRVLNDHHGRIRLDKYLALFEWLADELEQPMLGLNVSQSIGPEMLNAVSYLFLCSRNLESALHGMSKYVTAAQDATNLPIVYDGDLLSMQYELDVSGGPYRQDTEYSIGFVWNLMIRFTSDRLDAVQIEFTHKKPSKSGTRYRRIFKCPVLFQANHNAIVIRREDAQVPSRNYDPNLVPILEDHLNESMAALSDISSFAENVTSLLTEDTIAQGARAKRVARELGIAEVTLHRKLRSEGTSFKRLHDERSKSIAKRMIEQSQFKVSDIATRLGYAETACFTRAFQRWFGLSPREYRRNQK